MAPHLSCNVSSLKLMKCHPGSLRPWTGVPYLKLDVPARSLSSSRRTHQRSPVPCTKPLHLNERTVTFCRATAKDGAMKDISVDSDIALTLRAGWAKMALLLFCGIACGQAVGSLPVLPASALLASSLCFYSWAKESLSTSGLIAAWWVFALTHFSSYVVSAQLLAFFISSSRWTEYKAKTKDRFTADNKKSGKRNWVQVLCNGGLPTLFAVLFGQSVAFQQSGIALSTGLSTMSIFLFGCCLGSYACCCGDTWASEIGVLSKSSPRLITTLKRVPRGTNGGVSLLGLGASTFGGLLIGATTYIIALFSLRTVPFSEAASQHLPFILLGTVGGLMGSLVDSLLGATLQFSGFDQKLQKVVNHPGKEESSVSKITGVNILSNNQVNLLSSLLMALFIGGLTTLLYH